MNFNLKQYKANGNKGQLKGMMDGFWAKNKKNLNWIELKWEFFYFLNYVTSLKTFPIYYDVMQDSKQFEQEVRDGDGFSGLQRNKGRWNGIY